MCCALATGRSVFEEVGGFDARFFMIAEDVDYCWRVLLRGLSVGTAPEAAAWHRGGGATPGGYVRHGVIEMTAFRLALRERNTLAMVLKCSPSRELAWQMPVLAVRALGLAAALLVMRRPRAARDVVAGLTWNLRELPTTLRLRAAVRPTRTGRQSVSARMDRGFHSLELLRRYGWPRLIDAGGR